jgi:signal transduction histidine kinase/CheY-like chemotaxis protein/HPt (histidine-containing phosphotransfer) domain-containing protein
VRYIEDSDRVVRDAEGTVVHVVGLLRDVTEHIKAEGELRLYRQHLERLVEKRTTDLEEANGQLRNEVIERKLAMVSLQERTTELSQAKEYAERCNMAKTEFLANISHELRTPLHAIMGFADCLMAGAGADEATAYARHIVGESTILLSLLNELLDTAKVEAGKLELEVRSFELRKLLEQLVASMSLRAMQKGLALDCVLGNELPPFIKGDPNRLRQIVNNLMGNAVKFTERGTVSLEVNLKEKAGGRALIHFQVSDTGIGIPPEKHELIFERFIQGDGSTTRRYGGTGLGTTISRQLVHRMGGTIGMHSEMDKGSVFWFTIPFEVCSSLEEDSPGEEPEAGEMPGLKRGGRILLVEDYPVNQYIVEAYLSTEGYEVDSVDNGRKAVASAHERAYDVIIMDVQMPEMDGYEATGLIRRESALNRGTPILAMTASAFSDDIEKCILSGMNEVLTKPVRRAPFLTRIRKWIERSGEAETSPVPGTACCKSDKPEPMNFSRALAEFANDRETLVEVIYTFLESCLAQMALIDEAAGKGDFEAVRREAHKIKGGAGNLCAFPLEEAALALEKSAAASLADQVRDAFEQFNYELRRFESFVGKAWCADIKPAG